MRSFFRANYAVRLNKGIERKLIFGALASLGDSFAFSTYKYLGMGSMWFMDFILADRVLRVKQMVSFEFDRQDAARARTNIPLSVIEVRAGDAGGHLAKMRLEKERTICWLDFDNAVDDDILDTLRETAARMRSGSVLIATVAGTKPPSSTTVARDQWLRERFGHSVPATLAPRYFDDDDLRMYPRSLAELLHENLREHVRISTSSRVYRPLFGFVYRDGQRMVTVGGMVVSQADATRLNGSEALQLGYVGPHITVLEAPLLTTREKASLDRLLPTRRIAERRARKIGVRLSGSALASYAEWFREYPIFAEIEPR